MCLVQMWSRHFRIFPSQGTENQDVFCPVDAQKWTSHTGAAFRPEASIDSDWHIQVNKLHSIWRQNLETKSQRRRSKAGHISCLCSGSCQDSWTSLDTCCPKKILYNALSVSVSPMLEEDKMTMWHPESLVEIYASRKAISKICGALIEVQKKEKRYIYFKLYKGILQNLRS
ncbi:hypothetical protein Pelo_6464 [Pelomyxa schiedti]|nr:hypothetical protein Pelo_6464 [Pelomyxa schiedti]